MFQLPLLAFIQSICEFLPISSSGHLALLSSLKITSQNLDIDIALHLGTVLAVILYFRVFLWNLLTGFFYNSKERKTVILLILATVPALIVGYFLNDLIETIFRNPKIIAYNSIGYGALLWAVDYFCQKRKTLENLSYKGALFIGCTQALSLIPGTSRSGITITAARFLKMNRTDAAKFSMVLSIPVILSGAAYAFFFTPDETFPHLQSQILLSILYAFVFGSLVIWFLMRWIKKASFAIFAIYRILMGIVLLIIF